jgi:hypothetical protein
MRTAIWSMDNEAGDDTGWEKYGRKHLARRMAHQIGERKTPESLRAAADGRS